MPFAHALLLYICAGVGEALLAGPGLHGPAALQSPPAAAPHPVLPGYQIVLAFPATTTATGGGDLQFSSQPSPFRSTFFPVVAPQPPTFRPVHQPYVPAAVPSRHLFPEQNPSLDVDNHLTRDDRPVSLYASVPSRTRINQQHFSSRQFDQQDDSGVVQYSDTQNPNRVPPQYDSRQYPEVLGRFDSSRYLPEIHGTQSVANNEDERYPSHNGDVLFSDRHLKPSQREPDEFRRNNPHHTVEHISDRHFQSSQQSVYDFSNPQNQEIFESTVNQHIKPFYALNDRYFPKSHVEGRLNTFIYEMSYPSHNNQQITSIPRKQIQQYGHSDYQPNEYNSNTGEKLGSIYHQSNIPSIHFTNDVAAYSSSSKEPITLPTTQSLEENHRIHQVDKSNVYGYRYAMQSHNKYT